MNKPYVKQLDENGIVLNPITKEEPYLHRFISASSQKVYARYIVMPDGTRLKRKGNNRKPNARTGRKRNAAK